MQKKAAAKSVAVHITLPSKLQSECKRWVEHGYASNVSEMVVIALVQHFERLRRESATIDVSELIRADAGEPVPGEPREEDGKEAHPPSSDDHVPVGRSSHQGLREVQGLHR